MTKTGKEEKVARRLLPDFALEESFELHLYVVTYSI